MRIQLLAVGLFASVLPMKAAQPPIDLSRLLECLAEIEGGSATEVGGRVCCSYKVWEDRAPNLSYLLSANETAATPIFMAQLRWIVETLPKYKVPVTPESIATTWRFGIGKAAKLHGKSDYGQRASALMSDHSFKP